MRRRKAPGSLDPQENQRIAALLHITGTSRLVAVLKGDAKAIFSAASLATRTVDYLIGLQPKPEPGPGTGASGDPLRPPSDDSGVNGETPRGP